MGNKIAICAIAKNENLYIRDWVEYHKSLGIDKIFLYDNNDFHGEHFEDVIGDYIKLKYVKVFDRRGIEKGMVYDENNINLLNQCYIDTYNGLKDFGDFLWVFFIDIDEFINIKEGTLKEYLNSEKYKDYDTIVFPWAIYNDNNKLRYEPGKLKDRFPVKANDISELILVKCCVRIGKNIKDNDQFLLLHFMILEDEKVCYESGKPANWIYDSVDFNKTGHKKKFKKVLYPRSEVDDCNIIINHYRYKTLEEYLIRQYMRHWGTSRHHTNTVLTLDKLITNFFKYNKKTLEKMNIIMKFRNLIKNGKVIVNLYYKSEKQILNILDKLNKQSFKPTNILIHIDRKELRNSINTEVYKNFNIQYYYDTLNKQNYPDNILVKINNLKYKIRLNENTDYDDLFLKVQVIKAMFE